MSLALVKPTEPADVVQEIERHHVEAQRHAGDAKVRMASAMEHARHAGELLLQQRARLRHGQWLEWLKANVSFTARTAQRYMNAAAPNANATACRISNRPKLSAKASRQAAQLDQLAHRDRVVSHAALLVAELPVANSLRPADRETLTLLRAAIDQLLGDQHG